MQKIENESRPTLEKRKGHGENRIKSMEDLIAIRINLYINLRVSPGKVRRDRRI
jgi:hypothetical protein